MSPNSPDTSLHELLAETAWAQRLAASLVGHQAAEDLLQDTWAQAVQSAPQGALRSPRAWFATLMRRRAYNRARAEQNRIARELRVAQQREQAPADVLLAREEKRSELIDVLMNLGPQSREVIVLRFFEELAPAQIAQRLGVPASTVRSRLQRGLEELRQSLETNHGEDWQAWCATILPAGWGRDSLSASAGIGEKAIAAAALLMITGGLWWALGGADSPQAAGSPKTELIAQEAGPGSDSEGEAELPPLETSSPTRVVISEPVESEATSLAPDSSTRFYMIRGLCVDESRMPVVGMEVIAFNLLGQPSVQTGGDGRFALPITDLSSGENLLGVQQAGRPIESVRVAFESSTHFAPFERVELLDQVEIDMGAIGCVNAPHTLRGRVLGSLSQPAEQAIVVLVNNVTVAFDIKELFRTTLPGAGAVMPIGGMGFLQTGIDGLFSIRGVPTGHWRVGVFHNGHDGFLTDLFELNEDSLVDLGDIQLVECAKELSVRGRVLLPNGEPAEGFLVAGRAAYPTGSPGASAGSSRSLAPVVTDSEGRYCLPVPGSTTCMITAEGLGGRAHVREIEPGATEVNLLLPAPAGIGDVPGPTAGEFAVTGKVTLDGEPVAGAWVTCLQLSSIVQKGGPAQYSPPEATSRGRAVQTIRSAEDGSYGFSIDVDSSFVVEARAGNPGEYLLAQHLFEPAFEPRGDIRLDLELNRPGRIQGRVDGQGAEKWTGSVVRAKGSWDVPRKTTVSRDGRFTFDNLPPGRWVLSHISSMMDSNVASVEVSVASGQTASAVLHLASELACEVRTQFLLDGEPPKTLWTASAQVDRERVKARRIGANGHFGLDPCKPGSLRLQFLSRGHVFQAYVKQSPLSPGPSKVQVEVTTGSLSLTNAPVPDELDLEQSRVPCTLTWTGDDGLKWFAYLMKGDGGKLTLDQVPVGTIQLRYLKNRGSIPENQPVVAEFEVEAGKRTTFDCPPR